MHKYTHVFYLIITLLVGVLLGGIQETYAEPRKCLTGEFCSIKGDTREEINIYIENNRTAVRNIVAAVRNNGVVGPVNDPYENLPRFLIGGLNRSIEWESFDDYFDFYITSAMESSIPEPIYRDYQKLVDEGKRIRKVMNMVSDGGYIDMEITQLELCNGVNGVCSAGGKPPGGSLSTALDQLHQNNENIKNYFRLAITGDEAKFDDKKYMFLIPVAPNSGNNVEKNSKTLFTQSIDFYYGENAVAQCNQCSGGGFAEVSKSLKNISQTLKNQDKAYKNWKDAWYLLIGAKEKDRQQKLESDLLKKELYRQGLSSKNVEVMLANLDEYNNPKNISRTSGGFTWGNNYISNTFNYIAKNTESQLNTFSSTIDSSYDELSEATAKDINTSLVSLESFETSREEINTSVIIAQEIQALYDVQLEHAQKDDLFSDQLVGRIINTHINVNKAIHVLKTAQPTAEEVCHSQAAGRGKCSYGTHK